MHFFTKDATCEQLYQPEPTWFKKGRSLSEVYFLIDSLKSGIDKSILEIKLFVFYL